jgi:alkyl hydroperoxide reductase subunit F
MLDQNLKTQLEGYLARLTADVEIRARADDGESSREMLALLADIVALSPRVSLVVDRDGPGRVPSFGIASPGTPARVFFAGLPMGHEFTSLVLALLQVGGYPPKAEAAILDEARRLPGSFEFETFISLSCQNCPDVVQALNLLAVVNPGVRHTMIDGAAFQDEVERRQILAVPSVFLNGQPFGQGRMGLAEILSKLDASGAERAAAEMAARAPYDVLVVGGGPAGAAAAIYAARKGVRTGVAAERFGGQLLDTVGVENFISVSETDGPRLAAGLEEHVRDYPVEVMNLQRAEALVPGAGGAPTEVRFANGASLYAKAVIVATGARWREINVPGEREYRGRGVAYCPHCDGPLFRGKRVAVIGGGNSGAEAAIDLAGIVEHVTLIEYDRQLRADAVLTAKIASLANITVITGAETTEVRGDGQRVTALAYRDRATDARVEVPLAGVFVQIGLVPNTDWLKGVVRLSPRGEIEVDARGQTSVPGVFAAGDCTTVPFKQIVIAVGEGAKASLAAFDHLIRLPLAVAA